MGERGGLQQSHFLLVVLWKHRGFYAGYWRFKRLLGSASKFKVHV